MSGETNRAGSGNDARFACSACARLARDAGYDLIDPDNVIEGPDGPEHLTGQLADKWSLVCGFGGDDKIEMLGAGVFQRPQARWAWGYGNPPPRPTPPG